MDASKSSNYKRWLITVGFAISTVLKELSGNASYLYTVRNCFNCLQRFSRDKILIEHEKYSVQFQAQRTQFPSKENEYFNFTSYQKQVPVPFVIHADFSVSLDPVAHRNIS